MKINYQGQEETIVNEVLHAINFNQVNDTYAIFIKTNNELTFEEIILSFDTDNEDSHYKISLSQLFELPNNYLSEIDSYFLWEKDCLDALKLIWDNYPDPDCLSLNLISFIKESEFYRRKPENLEIEFTVPGTYFTISDAANFYDWFHAKEQDTFEFYGLYIDNRDRLRDFLEASLVTEI